MTKQKNKKLNLVIPLTVVLLSVIFATAITANSNIANAQFNPYFEMPAWQITGSGIDTIVYIDRGTAGSTRGHSLLFSVAPPPNSNLAHLTVGNHDAVPITTAPSRLIFRNFFPRNIPDGYYVRVPAGDWTISWQRIFDDAGVGVGYHVVTLNDDVILGTVPNNNNSNSNSNSSNTGNSNSDNSTNDDAENGGDNTSLIPSIDDFEW